MARFGSLLIIRCFPHFIVGTPDGVRTFAERHELGLFSHQEYLTAFEQAGLQVRHDPKGLDGRGQYLGNQPI